MKYNTIHKLKTVAPDAHAFIMGTIRNMQVPTAEQFYEGYISGILSGVWGCRLITLEERNELDQYYNSTAKRLWNR